MAGSNWSALPIVGSVRVVAGNLIGYGKGTDLTSRQWSGEQIATIGFFDCQDQTEAFMVNECQDGQYLKS